ncbi:MAG: M3 family metallopeptidase [Phycisphaerae bacterium]|nr:M3 family metallopeptidase [Phycisphaerae bacterium]
MTTAPLHFADRLNREYLERHVAKEDAFWTAYMGLTDDAVVARTALNEREIALQRWLQDPEQLDAVRRTMPSVQGDDAVILRGWENTFVAHCIDVPEARSLAETIVTLEGDLANARNGMTLGYIEPDGSFVAASSVKLGAMLRTDPDESKRRAAWNALRSIEDHVLASGFVAVVRERNRLGRMLGGEDYYDWKVRRVERMTKREIFDALGELEVLTRDAGRRGLAFLRERHGEAMVRPWNVSYLLSGDVTREQDPYFLFSDSIARWGTSFAAMNVRFRGAEMTLDLVDRPGKYENGFMHGPQPAWRERGRFHPARINFTANAIPGMIGAGFRATNTLFHEGGHAAHFANVDMPAPCFGQEFAPTSVAFAEIQSMFMDSILSDADWQRRYAKNSAGEPMPVELIEKAIRCSQPGAALGTRAMLAVCFAEKAIYEIPDDELSADSIRAAIRDAERQLVFLDEGSGRPSLSIPHLLSGESSAYYHGYVLADMGVRQTRDFFQRRDGFLCDNPRIGPDMAKAYWQPGNSATLNEMLSGLTGEMLSPRALARDVNRTADEAVAEAHERIAKARDLPPFRGPVDLDARICVVHGREEIARLDGDFEAFAAKFAAWVSGLAGSGT